MVVDRRLCPLLLSARTHVAWAVHGDRLCESTCAPVLLCLKATIVLVFSSLFGSYPLPSSSSTKFPAPEGRFDADILFRTARFPSFSSHCPGVGFVFVSTHCRRELLWWWLSKGADVRMQQNVIKTLGYWHFSLAEQ